MTYHMRTAIVIGLLILACPTNLPAAAPNDLAAYTPADTALYLGWSRWPNASQERIEAVRKLVKSMATEDKRSPALMEAVITGLMLPMSQAPLGIGLRKLEFVDGTPRVDAALVAAAGSEPRRYPEVMEKLVADYGDPARMQPVTIKNVQLQTYPIAETSMQFIWGLHKDCFLLALSEPAAAALIDTMNGAAPNLADADEVKFDRHKVQAKLDGAFVCAYADVSRALDIVRQFVTEQNDQLPEWFNPLVEQIGAASARSKYLDFEQREDENYTRIFAHVTGPVRGLLTLWKQPPLADEDLRCVPENAYWLYARSLDLAATWQEAMRIVGEVAPDVAQEIQGAEAMSAGMLGFSITRDLLPNFGHTWVLYDSPQQGGALFTGAVLVAETKDAGALSAMLSTIVGRISALIAQQELELQQKAIDRNGHQIQYVMVAGAPVPVAPAWCIVGQRVIFGLYPQTVASALDQMDAGTAATQPAAAQAGAKPAAIKSILENPEFRATRASLPGPPIGLGYADSSAVARVLYPLVLGLETLLISGSARHGAQIDFQTMPPWPDERQRIHAYVSTSSMDSDGIMLASNGGGGSQPVVGGLAAGGVAASVLLPSLVRARELSKRAVSMSNLRGIGAGCHIWANDHNDQFPTSLDELIADRFITPQMLHSPRDPTDEVSYIYIAGQGVNSDPRNVLAYERVFDRERTNVLFVDGHVEFMPLDAFKQLLADTYKRLGRQAEVPGEFSSQPTRAPAP